MVKDAAVLEDLEKVDTLVVDKTGTLTEGRPKLTEFVHRPSRQRETNCCGSPRPSNRTASIRSAGRSSTAAKERNIVAAERRRTFESITGGGVCGTVDGDASLIGNERFDSDEHGVADADVLSDRTAQLQHDGHTVMFVAVDGQLAGSSPSPIRSKRRRPPPSAHCTTSACES